MYYVGMSKVVNPDIIVWRNGDSEITISLTKDKTIKVDRCHVEFRILEREDEEDYVQMISTEIISRNIYRGGKISLEKEFEALKALADNYFRQYQHYATDLLKKSLVQIKNCANFTQFWR